MLKKLWAVTVFFWTVCTIIIVLNVSGSIVYAQNDPTGQGGLVQGTAKTSATCSDSNFSSATNNANICCPNQFLYYCGDTGAGSAGLCGTTQASCFGQPGAYNGSCNAGNTCNDPSLTCDSTTHKCLVGQGYSCLQFSLQYTCVSNLVCNKNSFNQYACCPGTQIWDGNKKACVAPPVTPTPTITPTIVSTNSQAPIIDPNLKKLILQTGYPQFPELIKQAAFVLPVFVALFWLF